MGWRTAGRSGVEEGPARLNSSPDTPYSNDMGGFGTIPAKELTHRRIIQALENGAIWLAANRAAFCDPILSEYYQSLKAGGKHHLTAVGAVARKMCSIIFTILKENRPYEVMPPKKGRRESNMQIRVITISDMPIWESLSSEYDCYVRELVGDLKEWYEGGDDSPVFFTYMETKISKQEAFMAVDSNNCCLGIIAFSKHHNRITFFGVSHNADFPVVGKALLFHAFQYLDVSHDIYINEIASPAAWIEQHRMLLSCFGFLPTSDASENGVPINVFLRSPDVL